MQKLIAAHLLHLLHYLLLSKSAICVCVGVIMQYVLIAGAEERM